VTVLFGEPAAAKAKTTVNAPKRIPTNFRKLESDRTRSRNQKGVATAPPGSMGGKNLTASQAHGEKKLLYIGCKEKAFYEKKL